MDYPAAWGNNDRDYRNELRDRADALFPQPAPSAEADTRAMQMTMADLLNQWDDVRHLNRCAINDWWYRRTSRHSLELQRLAAEPVSAADMATVTTEPIVCGGAATNCNHRFWPPAHSMACPVGRAENV